MLRGALKKAKEEAARKQILKLCFKYSVANELLKYLSDLCDRVELIRGFDATIVKSIRVRKLCFINISILVDVMFDKISHYPQFNNCDWSAHCFLNVTHYIGVFYYYVNWAASAVEESSEISGKAFLRLKFTSYLRSHYS